MNKIQGLNNRVKPKNEVWYLRIKNEDVFEVKTISKRERNILNGIRKMLIAHKILGANLTNRKKYLKNVRVSQEKFYKMKAQNKFAERDATRDLNENGKDR